MSEDYTKGYREGFKDGFEPGKAYGYVCGNAKCPTKVYCLNTPTQHFVTGMSTGPVLSDDC